MHCSHGCNFGDVTFDTTIYLMENKDVNFSGSISLPLLLQCFFPENIVPNIQTPLFVLNTAYDVWQVIFFLSL